MHHTKETTTTTTTTTTTAAANNNKQKSSCCTSLVGPAVHLAARHQPDVAEREKSVFVRHTRRLHTGLQLLRKRIRLVL